MNVKKRLICLVFFAIGILFIPIIDYQRDNDTTKEIEKITIFLKISYFNGSCDPISINGIGVNDWNWAENQSWCTKIGNTYYIENLTINGHNSSSCIDIQDSIELFIIRNCTLYNSSSSDAGIYLNSVNNGQIIDTYCSNNDLFGLEMHNSNNITISENTFYNNTAGGIAFLDGTNNIIHNNTFDNNDNYGMRFVGSVGINITENHISNSKYGIIFLNSAQQNLVLKNYLYNNSIKAIDIEGCNNNTFTSNSIYENGDAIYLINNCNYNQVINNSIYDNSQNGIKLENECDFNEIINNSIYDNGRGVFLDVGCDRNLIFNNEIYQSSGGSNYTTGILIVGSSNSCDFNNISENLIYNHSDYGIHFTGDCNNNSIFNNEIRDNEDYGIGIYSNSTYNDFLQNTITNNTIGFLIENSNYTEIRGNFFNGNNKSIKINGTSTGNIMNFNELDGILGPGYIDGDELTFGAFIWEEMVNFWWCSGNGESSNPYIIEDITLNGLNSTSCIIIDNSRKYFIIRNSTFFNSSSGTHDAGIKLVNVSNGVIYNNTLFNNSRSGIFLNQSHNNIITGNQIYNNPTGIWLNGSNYNRVLNNQFSGNVINITEIFCIGNIFFEPDGGGNDPVDDFLLILGNTLLLVLVGFILGITLLMIVRGIFGKKKLSNPSEIELQKPVVEEYENDEKYLAESISDERLASSMPQMESLHKQVNNTENITPALDISEEDDKQIQELEKEMDIKTPEFTCIVHKGPILGNMYLCPHCKTFYCQKCVAALKESGEKCWSCHEELN